MTDATHYTHDEAVAFRVERDKLRTQLARFTQGSDDKARWWRECEDLRAQLDAAQARIAELESEGYAGYLVSGLARATQRIAELERLNDGLDDERGRAVVRAEKAEARVKDLESDPNADLLLCRSRVAELEAQAKKTWEQGSALIAEADAKTDEARASEARMREALEIWSKGDTQRADIWTITHAALSTPVSDWLAARDRRVAEMQRARVVARYRDLMAHGPTVPGNWSTEEWLDATPLVEFKPEGA